MSFMDSFIFDLKRLFLIMVHCPVTDKLLCLADPGIQLIASISNFFYVPAPPNETMQHAPWYCSFLQFILHQVLPKTIQRYSCRLKVVVFASCPSLKTRLMAGHSKWSWGCVTMVTMVMMVPFFHLERQNRWPASRKITYVYFTQDWWICALGAHLFGIFVYSVFLWVRQREVCKINCHL